MYHQARIQAFRFYIYKLATIFDNYFDFYITTSVTIKNYVYQ